MRIRVKKLESDELSHYQQAGVELSSPRPRQSMMLLNRCSCLKNNGYLLYVDTSGAHANILFSKEII